MTDGGPGYRATTFLRAILSKLTLDSTTDSKTYLCVQP